MIQHQLQRSLKQQDQDLWELLLINNPITVLEIVPSKKKNLRAAGAHNAIMFDCPCSDSVGLFFLGTLNNHLQAAVSSLFRC